LLALNSIELIIDFICIVMPFSYTDICCFLNASFGSLFIRIVMPFSYTDICCFLNASFGSLGA
jgi:hypothetical protein